MIAAMRFIVSLLIAGQLSPAQRPRRVPQQSTASSGAYNLPAVTFAGSLKEITAKKIVLDSNEGQTVTIFRNHKTRFLQGDQSIDPKRIAEGTKLTLDVAKNPDGTLLAINVMVTVAPNPPK
jgi:hypothetical protein